MNCAVVTGASSGLGSEFVRQIYNENYDKIIVIARREDRLLSLREELGDKIEILPLDLTKDESFEIIRNYFKENSLLVKLLVSNAGFGVFGEFDRCDIDKTSASIELNCVALTKMTRLVLDFSEPSTRIINIASIASFAPNPNLAVYSSTKAYVKSFSIALREELKSQNINVTYVNPGPMKTEFMSVAGIEKGSSKAFDTMPYCNVKKVVKGALRASKNGRASYTNRFIYKLYSFAAKVLPSTFVSKFARV